jgi:hypothetical protein
MYVRTMYFSRMVRTGNAKKLLITVQGPVEHILLKKYFGDFPHGAGTVPYTCVHLEPNNNYSMYHTYVHTLCAHVLHESKNECTQASVEAVNLRLFLLHAPLLEACDTYSS